MSEGVSQAERPAAMASEAPDLFSKFDEVIRTRETLLSSNALAWKGGQRAQSQPMRKLLRERRRPEELDPS